nr:ORF74 [Acipenserid herpesvirus 1]
MSAQLLTWVTDTCKLKFDHKLLASVLEHVDPYNPQIKIDDKYMMETKQLPSPCYSLIDNQLMAIYVNTVTYINTKEKPSNSVEMSLLINEKNVLIK